MPWKKWTKSNRGGSAGWRVIAGRRIWFRSRWEFNYACYLELLRTRGHIRHWEHEPQTFWFEAIRRGVRSYLPDFRVTNNDGSIEYHEVKGWMDARSATALHRMAKYYPLVKIRVIDGPWFKQNTPMMAAIVPGWETTGKAREVERTDGRGNRHRRRGNGGRNTGATDNGRAEEKRDQG